MKLRKKIDNFSHKTVINKFNKDNKINNNDNETNVTDNETDVNDNNQELWTFDPGITNYY